MAMTQKGVPGCFGHAFFMSMITMTVQCATNPFGGAR